MFATVLKYMYFCTIIEKILHNMKCNTKNEYD